MYFKWIKIVCKLLYEELLISNNKWINNALLSINI